MRRTYETCTVEACERKHRANSYCEMHERRWKKYGDPHVKKNASGKTDVEKFFHYVRKTERCWYWTGGTVTKGYGQCFNNLIRGKLAHRVSFFIANSFLPDDLCVLHKCDNPPCVNPDHLFLGTRKDNSDDKIAKGRFRSGRSVGQQNRNSKLTNAQALDIRDSDESPRKLMERYQVSKATISRIRTRQGWTHL